MQKDLAISTKRSKESIMPEKSEVMQFVDEMLEKTNDRIKKESEVKKQWDQKMKLINSYGAVMLDNGAIINVKHNFVFFEDSWLQYVMAKELSDNEMMKEVLSVTKGGLFDSGDVTFKLSDVKMIFKPQVYFNSSDEEREEVDNKVEMIDDYMSRSIYGIDTGYPQDEE